jgi:hypothetical protein
VKAGAVGRKEGRKEVYYTAWSTHERRSWKRQICIYMVVIHMLYNPQFRSQVLTALTAPQISTSTSNNLSTKPPSIKALSTTYMSPIVCISYTLP